MISTVAPSAQWRSRSINHRIFFFGSFSFFFFILPSSERRFFNRIPRFRYGSAIAWNLANPPAPPPLSLSFFLPFSHRFHFFNEECTEFLDEDPQNWNLGAERRGEYPQRSSMDPAIETMAPFSSNYSEAADSIWLTKKKGKFKQKKKIRRLPRCHKHNLDGGDNNVVRLGGRPGRLTLVSEKFIWKKKLKYFHIDQLLFGAAWWKMERILGLLDLLDYL